MSEELIDKKAVINLIKPLIEIEPDLANLITQINALPKADEWVSMAEKGYPAHSSKVLCINKQGYLIIGAFWPDEKYFSGDDSFSNITHWQPLPKAPNQ